MSRIDLNSAPAPAVIAEFVVHCRGDGVLLPYSDLEIIQQWVAAAPSSEHLLALLSEILPDFYRKAREAPRKHPPSLRGLRKRVLSKLSDMRMMLAHAPAG